MAAATSVHVVTIIEPIIQHADWFFPDGMYPMYKSVFIFIKHFVWSHQNDVKKIKISHKYIASSPEVDFNVSGMFTMPTPVTNHVNHLTTPDYDSGTIERKRPGSMVGPDSDIPRRDR